MGIRASLNSLEVRSALSVDAQTADGGDVSHGSQRQIRLFAGRRWGVAGLWFTKRQEPVSCWQCMLVTYITNIGRLTWR
jgi:hypothetical protein